MKGNPKATKGSWPALSYEELIWAPNEDAYMPRSQKEAQRGRYKAALVPKIAAVKSVPISASTAAAADDASAETARFDAEMGHTVAPFAALLLRSESASSSKIENLTASAKAIALAELGDPSKQNAGIIVANTRAMEAAIALADRLDAQSILQMHKVLLHDVSPAWAGRWRTQQVWIGGSNYGPIGASFVPPQHKRIPAAIDDLFCFLARDDLPALVQATIAHAQFETIHPFPDGNGRTGRALLHAALRAKRLTRNVTVPISAGLLTDTEKYFDALTSYRRGDVDTLVVMMADAAFLAIDNGRRLVHDLELVRKSWDDKIRARKGATAWNLADLLVRQPVIDSPLAQHELGASAPAVNGAINQLAEMGILNKVAGNHRNRKWAANDVLKALDRFAERAGRRGG
jgi:Fic family protein